MIINEGRCQLVYVGVMGLRIENIEIGYELETLKNIAVLMFSHAQ